MIRKGILSVALLAAAPALAQDGPAFPGGASSLRETHGDWVVNCAVAEQRKICAISQQVGQKVKDSAAVQRVMSISFSPAARGAEGVLALPFGLLLAKGASLQIDDGKPQATVPIRTCLPAGCVAPLKLDQNQIAAMRKGKQLKVNVIAADSEKPVTITASLQGFGDALERAAALVK